MEREKINQVTRYGIISSTVDRLLRIYDTSDTCKDEDWSEIDDDFEWFC